MRPCRAGPVKDAGVTTRPYLTTRRRWKEGRLLSRRASRRRKNLLMWLTLAFTSAALLGFYDVFKKEALRDNAVLPVLLLNTLFSSLIFLPFILLSAWMPERMAEHPALYVPTVGWRFIALFC